MIKQFLLFYGISLLALASVCGIILLAVSDSLGKGILLAYAALFAAMAICISGGILSAAIYNNIYIPAIINFLIILIITMFVNKYSHATWLIYPSAAAMLTLIPALITKLIKYSLAQNSQDLQLVIIASVAILALAALYFAAAYCSTWTYSPFREETFFNYPMDERIEVAHSQDYKKSLLTDKKTKEPFTGMALVYKKQLKIDFTAPKATSLSFYINGRFVGSSVKRGTYVQDLIELENRYIKSELPKDIPKLIHKDYEKILKNEISLWNNYIVFSDIAVYTGYYASSGTIVTYEKDGKLYKKEITYHLNGIISSLKSYFYDRNEGWALSGRQYTFDSLGFNATSENYDTGTRYSDTKYNVWKGQDFVYTDNYDDFVISDASENEDLKNKLLNPDKMDFEQNSELWDKDKSLVDNFLNISGFSDAPISVYIELNSSSTSWLEQFKNVEDMKIFIENILERSKLTTDIFESYDNFDHLKYSRDKSVKFSILQKNTEKMADFWYYNGKFITQKGLYAFLPDSSNTAEIDKLIKKYNEIGKKHEFKE